MQPTVSTTAFALTLFVAPLAAQTTHLVGPGNLPNIAAALAIAVPGDVVHVQPGTYPPFTVTIGVTIRALAGGVAITGEVVCDPAPGHRLQLVRLSALGGITVNGGHVVLDSCGASSPGSGLGTLVVTNANLTLLDCSIQSFGEPAMRATNSAITSVGSGFFAGVFTQTNAAVELDGGSLHASGDSFVSLTMAATGRPGLRAAGNARAWLSDCIVQGTAGECGIVASGAATVRADRCTIAAVGPTCAPLPPGPTLLGVEPSNPIENGAPFTLTLRGAANTFVAVHASADLATTSAPGIFEQSLQLDPSAFWLAGVFVTDPTGVATATWNMPAGLYVDTAVWLEAITVEPTFPWQVAPVVGGVIR